MMVDRGKKLLLVEDEAIIALVTAKMLERSGYEVITVNDGDKAVKTVLNNTSIDLILMDIDLGNSISGPEAARRILQVMNIPIVFLTSHSEQEVVEMVREITRYGYVIKNSGDFVLLSSIEMAFELFASHERLKDSADYLRLSEERVKSKLDSILSPEGDIGNLELADIFDLNMLQFILDDFKTMTDIGVAIVDLKGNILAASEWQDICTKFHRINKDSCRNCIESDSTLTNGISAGNYKLYKCKNNMWEIATPIEVGGKHLGNLFLSHFVFEDDVIDYDLFRRQARDFGFDEKEYIRALDSVPRRKRDVIHTAMIFYIKLSTIISRLSYSNIKLARALTERDRYSSLHKEIETRLNEVTEHMVDLVARLDHEGYFVYVSPSYQKILGYRQDELVGTWAGDILYPSERDKNSRDIAKICSDGEGFTEFRLRHRNGDYLWFEATGRNIVGENGEVLGAVLGGRDITERKIAEKKLRKKDKQYRDLFEGMLDGFALHEIVVDEWGKPSDYIFLEVNPAFERYTGLIAGDIIGRKVSEFMPDIEPYWIATYGQVAFTGVQLTIENYSHELNKWFKVTAYSPERGFFATIFEDITDRKKAEELIKESDERYRRLFESVVGYVYTVFIENGIPVKTVHGPGCGIVTGYTPDDFVKDPELWYKMIYHEDRGRVILFASDIINKGVFSPVEHRIICKDGSMVWVRNTPIPHYDADKKLIEYDSAIVDITEIKNGELSLKESEARYRLIVDKNPLSIFLVRDGRLIYGNSAAAEKMGLSSPDDIIGMDIEKRIHPDDLATIRERSKRVLSGEVNPRAEIRILRPDGSLHLTESESFPITLSDGPAMLIIGKDITEQRKLEKEISLNLDKYRTVADFTYDWELWLDPDGHMIYCSPSCERITGYTRDEFINNPRLLHEIILPGDLHSPCLTEKDVPELPVSNETEFRIIKKDGSVRWIGHACRAVYDNSGKFTGRRGSNRDITERMDYYEKINSLLKEKELLLREVHHRIKNNMNTISGLLMLQAASSGNDAVVTALNDAQSRVQSMMIMYDKLYRSEDYRKMAVKEYLEKFIDEIFVIFENSRGVKIEMDISDFILDTKILFPIGIIINELITNAFKYAFPDGSDGVIKVMVKKVNNEVSISISDNGKGIPEEIVSSKTGGFGLSLVAALAEQIGGELNITKSNGTTVEIVFPSGP